MRQRVKPHPLAFTLYCLDQGLKKLNTVDAKLRPSEYNRTTYLWRGMKDMAVDVNKFFIEGG
jgi:hypothetical protein